MKLYREESIEAKRRRLWGEVRLAQPPSLLAWTAVLTVLCLVLFSALIFGSYTRKETVSGFLVPAAGVVNVRNVVGGRIVSVDVREGQVVQKGAQLLAFTSDLAGVSRNPVLDIQILESERQGEFLREREESVRREFVGERQRLVGQIASQEDLRSILGRQREVQVEALELAERDIDRIARLQGQGFAPNTEVDRRRRAALTERSALAELDSRISQSQATALDLRAQLAALPAREAQSLASVRGEQASLAQQRAELEVARGHVLRAPVGGTISYIQAREGLSPDPQTLLLSIAPTGSELEAHLLVPTRAAGFIKIGQPARIQVEAFPFARFGFLGGTIVDVTSTTLRAGDAQFPVEISEPVYLVRVKLEREYVTAYGERRALRAGMTLRADIPIDRRQLWQQLFDPLLAAGRRATG